MGLVPLLSVWEMCGFSGIAGSDGWWQGAMSPVQLPHLDSLRFVYGRGNTTGIRLAPSFSCPGPGSSPCQGHEGGTPFPGADGPHRATGVHPFRAAWLRGSDCISVGSAMCGVCCGSSSEWLQ